MNMYETTPLELGQNSVITVAISVLPLILLIFFTICLWKIFTKANQPGWFSVIPLYNLYMMCKICGKGIGFFILSLIPFVNFVTMILLSFALAKNFGKSTAFAIGLILLPIIFMPILAFDDSAYNGNSLV